MRVSSLLGVALLAAGFAAAATTATDAQERRVVYRSGEPSTVIRMTDEDGRTRTRIVVQRRSYLDGGTEVLPGQRKFTDYVDPPNQRPIDILGPGKGYERMPLNGFFDVPQNRGFY